MRLYDLFDQELTFANFLFGAGLIIGPIILAATAITVVAGVIRIIVMPMVAHGGMTRAEQTGAWAAGKNFGPSPVRPGSDSCGRHCGRFDPWFTALSIIALAVAAWLYRVARLEERALAVTHSGDRASN